MTRGRLAGADVREAPKYEIAGWGAAAVQQALWRFECCGRLGEDGSRPLG